MLSFALALLATLSTPPLAGPCDRMRGTMTESDGTRMTLTLSDDAHCLQVVVAGRVGVTDDDDDVTLEPGSTFVVTETRRGETRTLSIAERGGRLAREYVVNRTARPSAESAEWLRGVMLELVRGAGLGAEQRAARIARRYGTTGLLDEVGLIRADHVRRLYLAQGLQSPTLTDDDARRIALIAGQRIGSDQDKSAVLRAVVDRRGDRSTVAAAVVASAGSIGSDHDRRVVLEQVARRDGTTAEAARALLASTARLGSDHDKSSVLLTVLGRSDWMREPTVRAAFDAALKTVGSDAEYRRVAQAVNR